MTFIQKYSINYNAKITSSKNKKIMIYFIYHNNIGWCTYSAIIFCLDIYLKINKYCWKVWNKKRVRLKEIIHNFVCFSKNGIYTVFPKLLFFVQQIKYSICKSYQ